MTTDHTHSYNYHAYMVTPQDFEYDVTLTRADRGDAHTIRLMVAKVGGGELGESYSGYWYYRLDVDGETAQHGDDLETPMPKTHAEAARIIAGFLASDFPEGSNVAEALDAFAQE